mgnify:CR=1 FL=1
MVHPPSVYRLARAKPKFFINFCYMVPHWLKIAIQTLHATENMANTGPLYRLFQLSTHFLQIEGKQLTDGGFVVYDENLHIRELLSMRSAGLSALLKEMDHFMGETDVERIVRNITAKAPFRRCKL